VLTFSVGFAAMNTGNNLLYLVLSLMLGFLVLSGVMSESALRGIRVRRRLPREFYAGTATSVGLEIRNDLRRVPAFAVVVEDRVREPGAASRPAGRAFALRVDAGAQEVRSYQFTPSRRGPFAFEEFRVYTRFPFGLFSKSLTIPAPADSLAFPRVEVVAFPPQRGSQRDGGRPLPAPDGGGTSAVGLREFGRGDSARRIHWRSSLRHNELFVLEIDTERDAEYEVRLRTRDAAPGERFEERVSWAASEVCALIDADHRVALATDHQRFAADSGARHRAALLTILARVEPVPALAGGRT